MILYLTNITNVRNYYTHYNPKKEEGKLEGDDLLLMTIDLLLLLLICFLKELGFTKDDMRYIFALDKY